MKHGNNETFTWPVVTSLCIVVTMLIFGLIKMLGPGPQAELLR
jgi:hypothetical protein